MIGVQNLLKKHQALQAEIVGHEPRIKAVTQKGDAMVEEGIHLVCFSIFCLISSSSLELIANWCNNQAIKESDAWKCVRTLVKNLLSYLTASCMVFGIDLVVFW